MWVSKKFDIFFPISDAILILIDFPRWEQPTVVRGKNGIGKMEKQCFLILPMTKQTKNASSIVAVCSVCVWDV